MISFSSGLLVLGSLVSTCLSLTYQHADAITWLDEGRSLIVKLHMQGNPFPSRWEGEPQIESAVLLNLTMSHDHKTLLLNQAAILPLRDHNVPPALSAYQVPLDTPYEDLMSITKSGILAGPLTSALDREMPGARDALLDLDYDRIVWADPASGPYQIHVPTLQFRIMGTGKAKRADVKLNAPQQPVLHVTLTDRNHGSSDDAKRSYFISGVQIKSVENSYSYVPSMEGQQDECTSKSWRCTDKGLYQEGAPWYRFIWRSKFDQYGRVGSMRHLLFSKVGAVTESFKIAGPAMLLSFVILSAMTIVFYAIWLGSKAIWRWSGKRERRARELAEGDRLLGEKGEDEEMLVGDEDRNEDMESLPPLPPRPNTIRTAMEQEDLIVFDDA